jgi:hypothetical protein
MTDQDPDISGKIARLRPGHYAAIGGVCVAALLLTPALTALINHQHRKEASQAQLQAGGLGTPWHPPVIPVTTRACRQLSQIALAVRKTAAIKLRAVLS